MKALIFTTIAYLGLGSIFVQAMRDTPSLTAVIIGGIVTCVFQYMAYFEIRRESK